MAMQQGSVTLTGNLGADPVGFGRDPNNQGCSFRVGFSPGYFDQASGSWKNRETVWVKVRAFRALATNALQSLHKGDAVIVTGMLRMDKWTKDGIDRSAPVVEAQVIGHDLNCGISAFRRARSGQSTSAGTNDGSGQAGDAPTSNRMQGDAAQTPVSEASQPGVTTANVGATGCPAVASESGDGDTEAF